jgi:hypothetical protein
MLGLDTDHHPVRAHEVLDRRAFAQELGVGCDLDGEVRSRLGEQRLQLATGADRHRRFGDHHAVLD